MYHRHYRHAIDESVGVLDMTRHTVWYASSVCASRSDAAVPDQRKRLSFTIGRAVVATPLRPSATSAQPHEGIH